MTPGNDESPQPGAVTATEVAVAATDGSSPSPRLLSGTLWVAGAQILPGVVVAATLPTLIRRLGLPYFGIVEFAMAALALVGLVTTGLIIATTRWLSRAAASGDPDAASSLLASVAILAVAISLPLSLAVYLLAPFLVAHTHLEGLPHAPAIFYLRVAGWSLSLVLLQALLQGLITAHRRYRAASVATAVSKALMGIAAVTAVVLGGGLQGVAISALVVRIASVLALSLLARRHVSWRALRPRSLRSLDGFVAYAGQMTIVATVGTIDESADGVILGPGVSARATALYGAGESLGTALRWMSMSMLTPISVELARASGPEKRQELYGLYLHLQKRWVRFSTGLSAAAIGSVYFGVYAWLGDGFRDSAIVALILVLGDAVNLWTGVLVLFVGLVGHARLEAQYGAIASVINILLTVAVLKGGLLAVVSVTAFAEIVSSLYLIRLARRRLGPALPVRSFLRDVPWLPALTCAGLVALIELVSASIRPHGLVGLAVAGVPALVGLGAYHLMVTGPSAIAAHCRRTVSALRGSA